GLLIALLAIGIVVAVNRHPISGPVPRQTGTVSPDPKAAMILKLRKRVAKFRAKNVPSSQRAGRNRGADAACSDDGLTADLPWSQLSHLFESEFQRFPISPISLAFRIFLRFKHSFQLRFKPVRRILKKPATSHELLN